MVENYRVTDVAVYDEEVFMRAATLSIAGKKQEMIGRSVDRSIDKKVYNNHIPLLGNYINESYLNIDLFTLRGIDSDDEKRAAFIRQNTKFLDKNLLNVFFIKLIIRPGDVINSQDLDYLNMMLMWEMNDIYVMPILEFEGDVDRPERIRVYSEFVQNMLSTKKTFVSGQLNVGLSIPAYYNRASIPDLIHLYDDENSEPKFITLDFANSRISDPKKMGIVRFITKTYNEETNYFLYGLNLRPFKRGVSTPLAEDIQLAKTGFNGFGGPHYRLIRHYVPPATEWDQLGRAFVRSDYFYHPLSEEKVREDFIHWASLDYSIDSSRPVAEIAGSVRPVVKRYNFCRVNEELRDITVAIRKSDTDRLKDISIRGHNESQNYVD